MDGVLVVDKPLGLTSMRVVEQVRRLARERKAGHAGTLDPAASGVLPVCLGRGTKLVPYLHGGEKEYVATVRLGVETDTYDLDGTVTAEADVPDLSPELLAPHLEELTGDIMQRPPAYSALREGGERLYDKARRGEVVEPEPRPVTVHALELLALEGADVELRIRCGKGTYVRSLAADLGRALGCGGALAALRRTRVGALDLSSPRGAPAARGGQAHRAGAGRLRRAPRRRPRAGGRGGPNAPPRRRGGPRGHRRSHGRGPPPSAGIGKALDDRPLSIRGLSASAPVGAMAG